MTIIDRPFTGDNDWQRVRDLLIETYPLTPTGWNWEIRRWDGSRYHRTGDWVQDAQRRARVHLWETDTGRLVGVVNPEGRNDAHLQLHPDYRYIEADMIAWAEDHMAVPVQDGTGHELYMFVFEYDSPRRRVLEQRGWEKMPYGGMTRRLRLGSRPLPPVELANGYTLRTTRPGDEDDYQRMADVINAGFERDHHTATEYRFFATGTPSFRHDLNLVAEGPDGSFVAHVGVTYDAANRRGIVEPVCTHPDHRRKGLAKTLIFEGLHRLKALGATDVYVDTGDSAAASAFYESAGFTEAYQGYQWRKWVERGM